jgi:signal transduction histidine kinase
VAIVEDVATAFGQDQRYKDRCEVILDLDDVPPAFLDGSRVRQVVWNLLLNAAQATPDYGRIEVSVALDEDAVIIRISDEGVGISRDRLVRIFDPFYTTRTGGTGLGLANVERIVRAHGGAVSVSSTEGVGTVFSMSFPAVESRESSTEATLG